MEQSQADTRWIRRNSPRAYTIFLGDTHMGWLDRLLGDDPSKPRFSVVLVNKDIEGIYDRETKRTWGVREVLDAGAAEFKSCRLTIKEKQQAINDIGLENCVRLLDKRFKYLGKPYDARTAVLGVLRR